jgi:hypothetical protein
MVKSKPVSKRDALDLIQKQRQALQTLVENLREEEMVQPKLDNNRSVKDILAHIAAWEQRMLQWIDESYRGQVPQRPAPGMPWDDLDGMNEQIYLQNKDRPLAEVVAEFENSYRQALKTVEGMPEQDLFDGARFAWRKGDPMWNMVAANTSDHYREHREEIEKWLRGSRMQG